MMLSPPSAKKLSSMPDTLHPEHLGKQPAQQLLLRRTRRRAGLVGAILGRRQRPAVELAVRRQRQPIQHHKRRRNHVVRKAAAQHAPAAPQHRERGRRGRHHIGHQPLAAGLILARNHRSLRTPQGDAPAPPRSRRARCGSRASSPAHRRARRNSSTPSARQRARSPVRYIRLPAGPNGSATNRSAVSPADPDSRAPAPPPLCKARPHTPTGTGSRPPSST